MLFFKSAVAKHNDTTFAKNAGRNYQNTVHIYTASLYIKDRSSILSPLQYFPAFYGDQFGINYERRINSNWFIGLQYSFWKTWKTASSSYMLTVEPVSKDGDLAFRKKYRFLDAYGLYKYYYNKHHVFNAGLGISYLMGRHYYTYDYYLNPEPPIDERYNVYERKRSYIGMVPMVGYEYQFSKNRFNIGVSMRARYYANQLPPQYDLCFHI